MGKKTGRPSKYKTEYCEALIGHMRRGYSFETFGATLVPPCSKQTIYDWVEAHEEFLDAKKVGETLSQFHWEDEGMQGMHAEVFNATVWIFNMKNRFGWRDRHEIDQTVRNEISGQVNVKHTHELKKLSDLDLVELFMQKREVGEVLQIANPDEDE